MIIPIASDHAGYELKERVKKLVLDLGHEPCDFGANSGEKSVDYPKYGAKVAQAVSSGDYEKGILICGSGIGMSIVANKFPHIRAALCYNELAAEYAKKHNNANILVMGGRMIDGDTAFKITKIWLETEFEGGRHARRLEKIDELEKVACGKVR